MSEDWEAPGVANVQHGTQQATDLAGEEIWIEIDDIIRFCDDEKVQQILSYESEIHEPEEISDDQAKYYYDHMATFYKGMIGELQPHSHDEEYSEESCIEGLDYCLFHISATLCMN